MAIELPHLAPAGNEIISGAWTFSNISTQFPTRTRRAYMCARMFGQSNGDAMTLAFVGTYPDRYEEWPFVTAPSANQAIHTTFQIPQDYSSGGTWKVVYTQSSTNAVQWRAEVNLLAVIDGESFVAASEVNGVSITPAGVAATLQVDTIGNTGTLAAGDIVRVNFERTSDHADDTLTDSIHFIGLIFEYTAKY